MDNGTGAMPAARAAPTRLWIVGIAALVWNLIGVAAFVMQVVMPAETLAAMPEERRVMHESLPGAVQVFYGSATIGGVLGSLGLLLRRRWAVAVYVIALASLVLQVAAGYALTSAWATSGAAGLAFPVLLIVIAVLLVLFARSMASRGVLR